MAAGYEWGWRPFKYAKGGDYGVMMTVRTPSGDRSSVLPGRFASLAQAQDVAETLNKEY